ncbi:MAG: DNA polymerase [Candidatus Daviesbacteria bacterium]|nr:DNA polymerase [Candidatus Daviesbacteria bacterium]
MKTLVLVDGNALLHRAFHATPPFTTSKGELVNAVYGFTAMIFKVITDLKPDYLAVAWDEKGPTFRHQAYTQYKATRAPRDESLSGQYKRVFQIVDSLNIPEFSVSGYEADDLIGTLAVQATKIPNLEVVIATGDRDIMQLINHRVKVLMPKKTMADVGLYGEEEFAAKYGFEPKKLTDYKGLAGDASDNIPGVNGIGDVSATNLIHKFGTVEEIYKPENLKTLPERMQSLLAEGAEQAVMSKKLATLDLKAPIKLDLKKCVTQDFESEKVLSLLQELEFKSLLNRIPGGSGVIASGAKQSKSESDSSQIASSPAPRNDSKGKFADDLDNEVTPVLEQMSKNGFMVDLKFLSKLGKDLKARLAQIEKEIYSKIGHEFNLNSPKQLQVVLFDELNLPVFRKTKTGRSTDEETLLELKAAHPAIELLLEYRQLYKLVSTYVDSLPKYVGKDNRVHSTFNVEGAATGRLSSKDPNLQNIPIKGEKGSELRKAFVAPKGKVLLGADYSQIELRILAHVTRDPALKKAFEFGVDIHGATAAKIFNIPVGDVSKQQRMVGKTMNFATLYGQGPHALSRQLGVEYEVARTYIEEYFAQFPKIKQWMREVLKFGLKKGYVETLLGRRRYIPELISSNHMIKSAGERAAINHPIQGTSADMIKRAMVDIEKEIASSPSAPRNDVIASEAKQSSSCQMILQVHDELLFECDPKEVEKIAKIVKEKMENAIKLSVPVVVDLKTGPNWGEMKPIEI